MLFAYFNYHEYDTPVQYSLTRRGKKLSELLDELKKNNRH